MTELEKWETINGAESAQKLESSIREIAEDGQIQGRSKPWDAEMQASYVRGVVGDVHPARCLTRSYGIRQQAIYLKQYRGR